MVDISPQATRPLMRITLPTVRAQEAESEQNLQISPKEDT